MSCGHLSAPFTIFRYRLLVLQLGLRDVRHLGILDDCHGGRDADLDDVLRGGLHDDPGDDLLDGPPDLIVGDHPDALDNYFGCGLHDDRPFALADSLLQRFQLQLLQFLHFRLAALPAKPETQVGAQQYWPAIRHHHRAHGRPRCIRGG